MILTGNRTAHNCDYSMLRILNKNSFQLDGKGFEINGDNRIAHLIEIYDSKGVVIKNLTLKNGNTKALKKLIRKDISTRNKKVSIFELIDGGAVIIAGDSDVSFINCRFINNKSVMCGGAISNQSKGIVRFKDCFFEGNAAGHTGSAIDNLVKGAKIEVYNCVFNNNKSNLWHRYMAPHGHISLFPKTEAQIIYSCFNGGSIPFDYYKNSKIKYLGNSYLGDWDWLESNIISRERNFLQDYFNLLKYLFWIVPKTLGKVSYSLP